MTEVLDPTSMIDAAQEAVARGDLPDAERLLREAAAVQETTLGSEHPDLATTLNNLAFVCERTNKVADAEHNYRRAHAIAVASLGPKHPFVATSIKNLVDFCEAHDIPIWKPPSIPTEVPTEVPTDAAAATQPSVDTASENLAESREELAEVEEESMPVARTPIARRIAIAGVGLAAVVVLMFTMRAPSPSPNDAPAPTPATLPPALVATPSVPEGTKSDTAPPARVEPPAARANVERLAPREKEKAATPPAITVLNARLCSALKKSGSPDWQCTLVRLRQGSDETGLPPGTYSFYTRLLTTANATVEHRWYRDGHVHQTMRLRITANPSGGYRTFSSNTISPERAGDWKVELRDADGAVLHEERFVIR